MKNLIIITGGAGFVGSNLISLFLKKTGIDLISILCDLKKYRIYKSNEKSNGGFLNFPKKDL